MDTIPPDFTVTINNLSPETGRQWLERLPTLIAQCEAAWSISAMAPLEPLSYHYVAPAVRSDGTEVILKLGMPHPELTSEIKALSLFAGRGCVRLLEADQDRGALLLESLKPGLSLRTVVDDDEATRIAAGVMRRLWRPAPPDHAFATAGKWALGLEKMRLHFEGGTGPLPKDLVEKAEGLSRELLGSMDEPALLHGDLHHENILSAERQPWLAIDPKGLVAEPAYETGALLRNLWPHRLAQPRPAQAIARRVDLLAEEIGFDRARILAWGLYQAVLAAWWCLEDQLECWQYFAEHATLIDSLTAS
jgi:streptomycin 6-kinase